MGAAFTMQRGRKRAEKPSEAEKAAAAGAADIEDVDGDGATHGAPADKAAEGGGARQPPSSKKNKSGEEPRVVVANYNEVERWVRMPCVHFCMCTLRMNA